MNLRAHQEASRGSERQNYSTDFSEPSPMMRITGSVPEGRIISRPPAPRLVNGGNDGYFFELAFLCAHVPQNLRERFEAAANIADAPTAAFHRCKNLQGSDEASARGGEI